MGTDAAALATRYWSAGHGLISLVLYGAVPRAALPDHAAALAHALFTAAGDERDRCARSIAEVAARAVKDTVATP